MERSGTSLLHRMLDAHPQISLFQSSFVGNLLRSWEKGIQNERQLDTFLQELFTRTRYKAKTIDRRKLFETLKNNLPLDCSELMYATFKGLPTDSRGDDPAYWGEKYILPEERVVDSYMHVFPTLKVIHIVRDGRAVFCSSAAAHAKRKRNLSGDVFSLAERWRRAARLQELFANKPECYLEVRYESLVRETKPTLTRVTDFLSLPFYEAMIVREKSRVTDIHALLNHPPDASRIDAWKLEGNSSEVRIFDFLTRSDLSRLGYPELPSEISKNKMSILVEVLAYWSRKVTSHRLVRLKAILNG